MKPFTMVVLATFGWSCAAAVAADATSPVNYTQRNDPYAPAASVTPEKQKPTANKTVQDKRVEKVSIEKQKSHLQEREAALDVSETRPKQVREKDSHRPEVREQPTSGFNHRPATISTAADTTKPVMVAKYQDSLTATNVVKVTSSSALDRATAAKINRFVFRKNPSEPAGVGKDGPVIPAAGGSVLKK